MSPVVFISYNSASEYEIAHQLARDLESAGRSVWIAPESIRAGESFPSAISRGLHSATLFLLLVTPAALGSRWVKAELDAAIDLEKKGRLRLIPVVIKETVLPPLLASYQSLRYAGDYEAFLEPLGELLKLKLAPGVAPRSPSVDTFEIRTAPLTTMPLDDYARSVFTALQLGEEHYEYMTNLVARHDSGAMTLIVERELLRVGVMVFARTDDEGRVHARLMEELDDNPQKVNGAVAVQPGEQLWMETYRIARDDQTGRHLQPWRDSGSGQDEAPRIVHLLWKAGHGDSALVQALDTFFRLLQRNRTALPLEMDAYVEAALRAVQRSADVLNFATELPDAARSSIVRLILSPPGIRIGVAVWADNDPELDDVRAGMSRELHANPSDVSALIGIVPSHDTGLQPYEETQPRGQPDSYLLRWNPKAGADAIRLALVQILEPIDRSGEGDVDPFAAAFHQGRADAFLEVGMAEEALLEAEDAILLNPNLADVHGLRAQALLALDRPAAALNAAEQALALDPGAIAAYAIQADALLAAGRPQDAVEAAERGLELDAKFPALHAIRADALVELDQPEDALAAAEEAVKLDVHDPRNHASEAIALLNLERFEQAIKAADAALALDPDERTAGRVKEDAFRKLKRRRGERPPPKSRR